MIRVNSQFRLKLMMLFLVINTCTIAQDASNELEWTKIDGLTFNDFKKSVSTVPQKQKVGKNTYVTLEGYIYCGIKFSYEQKGNNLKYEVYSFMEPSQSWIRDMNNVGTLEHEQAHFNITEIYARKLKYELRNEWNLKRAKKKYKQVFKALAKKHQEFDKDHHGEFGVERKWQEWIANQLRELDPYAEKSLIVRR